MKTALLSLLSLLSLASLLCADQFALDFRAGTSGPFSQKLFNSSANKLLGTASSGDPTVITLGTGLTLSGTTLSASGGAWGSITGTLASQTDLQTALDAKASTSSLSSYLTTATAASTYASLSGSYANPSWITSLAWSKLTGVPSTFTPAAHDQAISTITGLEDALDGKSPLAGSSSITTVGTLTAGEIPASLITGNLTSSQLPTNIQVDGTIIAGGSSGSTLRGFHRSITHTHGPTGRIANLFFPDFATVSSNRAYLLPDNATTSTQTLVTQSDTGTISTGMLADASVTNAKLAGSITLAKLAQSSATSGQVIAWDGSIWAPTTLSSASLSGANTWTGLNKFSNGIWSHRGNDNGVVIGYQAAESATAAASDCVAIGFFAIGSPATTPTQGVAIGRHAGFSAGGGQYFIGGHAAGQYAYNASNSVILGYLAGRNPTQNASAYHFSAVIIGHEACMSTASAQTGTVIGAQAGRNSNNTTGAVLAGYAAGQSATTATNAVLIGNNAGQSATAATNAIFIGNSAGQSQTSGNNTLIIDGNSSTATSSSTAFITGNMATGTRSLNLNASTLTLGVSGGQVIINTPAAPSTSSSTGTAGQIRWDADYLYICTGTNTWRRIAHASW